MEDRKARVEAFFRDTKGAGGTGGLRPGMRARIYVRVSDLRGREDNNITIENQIEYCTRYARDQQLVLVGEPVQDLNLSGSSFNKRSISRMIEEVRQDQYDVIIVWKWSRWGRNLNQSMVNLALLAEVGGILVAATEPGNVTTPTGVFTLNTFLSMAQLQLDQIREGWRDAHRTRLAKGLPHSGIVPFGYLYDPEQKEPEKAYSPDPDTFPLLQEMYQKYIHGTSHRGIALDLNARGFTGRKGALWTPTTVRQVLDSGFGAGRISYGKFEEFTETWEHAVTAEEWEKYQQRREHAGDHLPPRVAGQKTMAKGLVHCADCDRRMSLTRYTQRKNGKEYKYAQWRCSGVVDLRCKGSMIRETAIIEKVRSWVEMMSKGGDDLPEIVARRMRVEKATVDIAEIEREIVHTKGLKRNALKLRNAGEIDADELKEMREEYDRDLARLEGALQASRSDAAVNAVPPTEAFGPLLDAIDLNMEPDSLNTVLKSVVGKIIVSKSSGPGRRPLERIKIVPKWEMRERPALEAAS